MKTALVTGYGGQDGYYMAEVLSNNEYHVIATVHDKEDLPISKNVEIRKVNFTDYSNLYELVGKIKPDEIYNFAAQSSSIYSWENTRETFELNLMSPVAILEGIRDYVPWCRFFQASSAEIYGANPKEVPQLETTPFEPLTPYATAKAAAVEIIKNYRQKYGIYAVNGIFYNHESVRRKESFLPSKIARTVAKIKVGKENCLYVGNIYSQRDWGYSPDYMYAAWRTLQLERPDDYIFATGIFHTVKEMIEKSFESVDIRISWKGEGVDETACTENGDIVVRIDPKFYRDYDRCNSIGDARKLYKAIDWKPKTSFNEMISYMTRFFLEVENV